MQLFDIVVLRSAGICSILNDRNLITIKRFFECTINIAIFSATIGLLGLSSIANATDPTVQQQLETLTRQLEQQQIMMQQQQSLIEQMQRQLDEQKLAAEKMQQNAKKELERIHVKGQKIAHDVTIEEQELTLEEQKFHARGQEIDTHIVRDEQKVHARGQEIDTHIAKDEQEVHVKGQELEHKTDKAQDDATLALQEIKTVATDTGVNLSQEMFRYQGAGTTIKAPVADTQLTIGGFIRASFIHDFNAIESPYEFVTKDIVVNGVSSGVPDKRTTFTANASRLFFSSATPLKIGQLTTFFSFDLAGNTTSASPEFHFRQGWAQLDDFIFDGNLRVGQAWSTWVDVDVLPETMDFQGPNGSQQNHQPLVRWSRDYAKAFLFEIALENPGYAITDGSTSTGMPDTIAAFTWHQDWGHLRSAFMARHIRGDDNSGHSDTEFGWGLQVSGDIKLPQIHKKDNFKFQMVYGAGTGSYNNDGYDDAIFTTTGDLRTVNAFQGFAAYQHWWTDSIRSNAVFGWVDMDNNFALTADDLDRTLYAAGNLVWTPYKQVDIGFEYIWGQRRNVNYASDTANRIQATTHFSF